jgi:hypothetical protein
MWVYGLVASGPASGLLDDDPEAQQLGDFAAANGLSELYLGVGQKVLPDPRLPAFVRGLRDRGLRVEALLSDGASMAQRIADLLAYQPAVAASDRFDGVHLDLEPWIGTGEDYGWVPGLIVRYQQAGAALAGSGLSLAADLSGVKAIKVKPADQQALLDAATRIVLMEYEAPVATVVTRVDAFRQGVDLSSASFQVATRVKDFAAADLGYAPGGACQNGSVLAGLDAGYAGAKSYAGWATFDYRPYLDPLICPDDCCLVQ